MKQDTAYYQWLLQPVRLPEDIGEAEQLAAEGRTHVKKLIAEAICNQALPQGIKFLQCVHVRPGYLDLGSPSAVHIDQHKEIVSANLIRAHDVHWSRPENSFFFRATNEGLPLGSVALVSKSRGVTGLRGELGLPFTKVWLKSPPNPDATKLTGYLENVLCEGWHWIDNLEALLRDNDDWLSAYKKDELNKWEPSVPRVVSESVSKESPSVALLQDANYLRRFAPLVACGHVLLCAPVIYSSVNGGRAAQLGGGGCMFILERLPNVHQIRQLFLASQKLISTIWTYQDFVRSASTSGANAAIRMITHSFGNAVNYIPESSPRALRVLRAEDQVVRAARLLFSESRPGEGDYTIFNKQWLCDTSCMAGEELLIESDLEGRRIDCRLFALLVEIARNCIKHSVDSPKKGTLRTTFEGGNWCILGSNHCSYISVRDLKKKLEHISASSALVKGFDFVIWLARALATNETRIIVEVTSANTTNRRGEVQIQVSSFRGMPIELTIEQQVALELPKLEAAGDVGHKFRISFQIRNVQHTAIQ